MAYKVIPTKKLKNKNGKRLVLFQYNGEGLTKKQIQREVTRMSKGLQKKGRPGELFYQVYTGKDTPKPWISSKWSNIGKKVGIINVLDYDADDADEVDDDQGPDEYTKFNIFIRFN